MSLKALESCNGKAHESDESKEVGAETIHSKGKDAMESRNLVFDDSRHGVLEAPPNFDSQCFIGDMG